ncbi:protein-cysteine N-palmitoyltransferase HHAT-like [Clytia hemisphaerica]
MNVLYLATCQFIKRHLSERYHKPCRLVIGLSMLSGVLSVNAVALMMTYMILFFSLVMWTRSKLITWLAILCSVYITQQNDMMKVPFDLFGVYGQYEEVCRLCFFLAYLRCADFGCDVTNSTNATPTKAEVDDAETDDGEEQDSTDDKNEENIASEFLDFLDYIFYIPLFFSGPVLTMKYFMNGDKNKAKINKMEILKDISTSLLYVLIMDQVVFKYTSTALTHLYSGLFLYQLGSFDSMCLAFYHVQIFCIKYTIFYRFVGIFAKLDGHIPPGTPKCAQMTLTFTDMWRTFDQGLYKILQKNIYFPIGGSRRGVPVQILSSFLCFLFVAFWHGGTQRNHLLWGLLNWFGVIMESIGRILMRRFATEDFIKRNKILSAACLSVSGIARVFANLVYLINIKPTEILFTNVFKSWKGIFSVFGVAFLGADMALDLEEILSAK